MQTVGVELVIHKTRLRDYLELTKPEVTSLVLFTTLAGFYLASDGMLDLIRLFHTLVGTAFAAAGTAALNQFLERDTDAKMRRTARRPLPAGRMPPGQVLSYGAALAVAGVLYLLLLVNFLASFLALITLSSYLLLYTPLKSKTPLCTVVGASAGAVPPLIGWAAARNSLGPEAWVLYAIVFLWQFPHFLAIAWMYREDYARAGILMLLPTDPEGHATFRQIAICSLLLVLVSVLPALLGLAGRVYFFGALVLGLVLLQFAFTGTLSRSILRAKQLVYASVIYLPLLFGLLMLDKRIP